MNLPTGGRQDFADEDNYRLRMASMAECERAKKKEIGREDTAITPRSG